MAVAHHAVVPVVARALVARALRFANRVAKAVLGEIHGREHAARFVVERLVVQHAHQRLLGTQRQARVAR